MPGTNYRQVILNFSWSCNQKLVFAGPLSKVTWGQGLLFARYGDFSWSLVTYKSLYENGQYITAFDVFLILTLRSKICKLCYFWSGYWLLTIERPGTWLIRYKNRKRADIERPFEGATLCQKDAKSTKHGQFINYIMF